jgi:hypothetical protein
MTNINHPGNFEIAVSPEKFGRSWNFLDNNRGNTDPTTTEHFSHQSPQPEHKIFENHKPSRIHPGSTLAPQLVRQNIMVDNVITDR